MVLVQDVLRYFLSPVERTFRKWEAGTGVKSKIARIFRIGNTGPGTFETMLKMMNNYYMWLFYIAQRPWGPLYKRIFEFDMHPTKITFPFFTHTWILLFWFGHSFVDDQYNERMVQNNSDYLAYYVAKYQRLLPHNALNWRTSAHYVEINRIYTVEMMKKLKVLTRKMNEESQRKKALALTS